jgi:probable rRNA maturation factor
MTSSIHCDVVRESRAWDGSVPGDRLIRQAIATAVETAGLVHARDAELCVLLSNDERVRRLNAAWRGQDRPTNVLSFPAVARDRIAAAELLGDVVLAYETVEREARETGRSFQHHFVHLLVHGVLHVFGYDHGNDEEADGMERMETAILARLGVRDPYADQGQRAAS